MPSSRREEKIERRRRKNEKAHFRTTTSEGSKSMKERDSRIKVKEDRHSIRQKVVVKEPVGDPKQDIEIYGNFDVEDTNDGDLKDVFGAEPPKTCFCGSSFPKWPQAAPSALIRKEPVWTTRLAILIRKRRKSARLPGNGTEWVPF